MITLDSPVEAVLGSPRDKSAGRVLARITDGLGLRTVGDLLGHHPRRYLETGTLTQLETLQEGQLVTLVGEVASCHLAPYRDKRTGRTAYRVEVTVRADGASLRLSFFAKSQRVAQWQAGRLAQGRRGVFVGQVSRFRGDWQLTHPQMILFGDDESDGGEEGGSADARAGLSLDAIGELYPIYPLTKGLESWDLQRAVTFARAVLDDVPDVIPASVRREHGLLDARSAIDQVHAPQSRAQVHAAHRRYRFEEALVTQLVLARRRRFVRALGTFARDGTRSDGSRGGLLAAFDARLPFALTAGQREIGAQVEADLAESHPMNRLLQGEVGSGKTVVALRAMLRVVDSGGQAALLAPTEVLAQQHHRSVTAMLGDLAGGGMLPFNDEAGNGGTGAEEATSVELLTGSMGKRERTAPLSRLAVGEAGIVIGTHALLEDQVQFHDLGLVVVDEQHRFGVEQRAALTDKSLGSPPHVLVMTATPIPRTVAMTVFGDLEVSTLTELPAGRAPIQTTVVPVRDQPAWLDRVWQRVREEVDKGHQVYVVCPRISADDLEAGQVEHDEGARPAMASVEAVLADLTTHDLVGLRIEPIHGRLTPDDKDRTMRRFADGEIDVLVSTTVIEVGVDVPNATAMVVMDAERFGISQLHQLRGRVGRGGLPGLCLLVTWIEPAAPGEPPSPARVRLDALAATSDGFELSRVDLEQRREGDVLGSSQAGYRSTLANLRVLRDEDTIVEARVAAEALLDQTAVGGEDLADHPDLRAAVLALEASVQGSFMEKS